MHFQFQVAPPNASAIPDPPALVSSNETNDLLRQLIEAQREQIGLLRAMVAVHDNTSRWRAFLARWQSDYPDVGSQCRTMMPMIERAYMGMIADLLEMLNRDGAETLENEFTLNEFLDRYGVRLGQLGGIVSLISPLAEAARTDE